MPKKPVQPLTRLIGYSILILCSAGCSPLVPFCEIRQSIPDGEFLKIDDQWVHIESEGESEPIVLLHGFGGSTYSWRHILPQLAERRYRAVAIDLNGFGFTQRPKRPQAYSIMGQQDLVLGVIAALEIEQVHLVGHSYGAGIALRIAADYPNRVKSVTLVDGGASGRTGPAIPEAIKPLVLCWVKYFALTEDNIRDLLEGAVHRKEVITDEVVQAYLQRLRIEGLDDSFYGLASQSPTQPSIDLSKLDIPVQILWGVHDPVIPIRAGVELASQIPGAHLIRFEESGHLPMEEQPEAFVEALTDFVGYMP